MPSPRVLSLIGSLALWTVAAATAADPLPGTQPLTWDGDISLRMVDDLHAFADRETAASIERRARHWKRDFADRYVYQRSIEDNRKRLAQYLGVPLQPRPVDTGSVDPFEPLRSIDNAFVDVGNPVESVKWKAVDGRISYGFRIRPSGNRKATAAAIVIVDPDLKPLDVQQFVFPQRLSEAGLEVYVMPIVDRRSQFSRISAPGDWKRLAITHREFVYRQAFEMGKHVVGFEVSAVLGLAYALNVRHLPVLIFGFGGGGDVALFAGALQPNIRSVGVCAAFGNKQKLAERPIDQNVWGLIDEFGDAELASMIVGRPLLIDWGAGFSYAVVKSAGSPKPIAAPGDLVLPTEAEAKSELLRAARLIAPLTQQPGVVGFAAASAEMESGQPKPFESHFELLTAPPNPVNLQLIAFEKPLVEFFDEHKYRDFFLDSIADRRVKEMRDDTQALVRESEYVRKDWWKNADRASRDPEKWRASCASYRKHLYDEVLGRFDMPKLPPNARTRQIYDTPKYAGYEVVLDVFGKDASQVDVWAYGVLLVPKDLKTGERRPVVVCQHGLEGRPQDTIEANVPGERYYHRFAAQLAERGFVVFAPQNPYIGKNHFRQLVRKLWPLKKTLWSVIVPQHEQITDWLASLPFVDGERIGFYGLSYGGKTAMRVPALVERYCLSICSGDFNEWIRKCTSVRDPFSYMGTGEYEMFEFDLGHTFNYAEMAYLIAPRPFMVERGHRDGVGIDEWVAYEYAKVQLLYADLKIPERTEIEYFDGPHEIHGVGTFRFLHKHLRWPTPE